MTKEEFMLGLETFEVAFPSHKIYEYWAESTYEKFFSNPKYNAELWLKTCHEISTTSKFFPAISLMVSTYQELELEKQSYRPTLTYDCTRCQGRGLIWYQRTKWICGMQVVYDYVASCGCQVENKRNRSYPTWDELSARGTFRTLEGKDLPRYYPHNDMRTAPYGV